ncbi:hypothetical protein FGK63_18910 [Ruegeria sediminis]|uniref:Glycosyltransferase family 2 protein n=1 Tax=Ruegeria sediminis TaxID=2583820 RepID=A0ABY2WTF9_9RHOB|nr:hypothetical protein [Ruegeria sediminis]TMV03741.1 hypothetical protein FGK63_18910 [Ruegeria sediminis]
MSIDSLNILGLARDGGQDLIQTLQRVDVLRANLAESRVIIATNDNSDGTDRVLADYAARSPATEILDLDGLTVTIPDRVERITHARNQVLQRLFASSSAHPATLVLDLDGPNAALEADAVLRALRRQAPAWDAVFANAQPAYYDLYALRCEGWCDEDVWQQIHTARKPWFFRRRWRQDLLRNVIYSRQYHIPADAPLIPVDSAFAGLGLYRTGSLKGLHYSCRDEKGGLVCEHVQLHRQIRARGGRLYIDPGLTTIAPSEHLGEASGAPFPQRLYRDETKAG